MRKLISFLASAVICGAMFSASAYAANVIVDIDKTEVEAGEVIKVEVSVPDMTVSTLTTGIQFNTDEFEVVDVCGADSSDKSWFFLVDKNGPARYPYWDVDVAPSVEVGNSTGTLSVFFSNGGENMEAEGGILFTATLKALKDGDAIISWFEDSDVDGTDEGDVYEDPVDTATIKVGKDQPENNYGTAGNDFEGKASKYWTVKYTADELKAGKTISLSNGTRTEDIDVTVAEDYDISGDVSFYVYVIGSDIADVYIVE